MMRWGDGRVSYDGGVVGEFRMMVVWWESVVLWEIMIGWADYYND